MTGMRKVTKDLGIVEQTPPQAILRQRAAGLLRRVPRGRRKTGIELAHWGYGAAGGVGFALLPEGFAAAHGQDRPTGSRSGPVSSSGSRRLLGLTQAKRARPAERIAFAADHLLYGLVLSEFRPRPQEGDGAGRSARRRRRRAAVSRVMAEPARGRRAASPVRVRGTVQGVGFRPYVFRLADELGLDGFVLNDERGVLIEAEGSANAIERPARPAARRGPAAGRIEAIEVEDARPTAERGFRILESERRGEPEALVSPDTATCADCLAELFDPADRRYRYPFINCTNCGPRFTIVRGIPYDRPLTTMAGFEICPTCRAEYEDPADRRFHAQPNACPQCGPRARLADRDGRAASGVGLGRPRPDRGGGEAAGGGQDRRRSRASAAFTSPAGPTTRARSAALRRAQAPRAAAARADGRRTWLAARELIELTPADAALLESPAAPDRDRPPLQGRRGRRRGRAAFSRSRGDAALLAASPPATRRRRNHARDDLRQPLR